MTKKKRINSRMKGKNGELELVNYLKRRGYEARRGQQFKGTPDSPDIISNLEGIHIECKRVEHGNPYNWLEQSNEDVFFDPTQIPVVMHRRSKKPWIVVMYLEDFLTLREKANE